MVAEYSHHPVTRMEAAQTGGKVAGLLLGASRHEVASDRDQVGRLPIHGPDDIAQPIHGHPVAQVDIAYLGDTIATERWGEPGQSQRDMSDFDPDRLDERRVRGSGQCRQAGGGNSVPQKMSP